MPVRVKKMRQNKGLGLLSDSAETESALGVLVAPALFSRRYDRAALGTEIGLILQEACVNFRMIWNNRAAKVQGVVLTSGRLLLNGVLAQGGSRH
jgi:hypothetical protein